MRTRDEHTASAASAASARRALVRMAPRACTATCRKCETASECDCAQPHAAYAVQTRSEPALTCTERRKHSTIIETQAACSSRESHQSRVASRAWVIDQQLKRSLAVHAVISFALTTACQAGAAVESCLQWHARTCAQGTDVGSASSISTVCGGG